MCFMDKCYNIIGFCIFGILLMTSAISCREDFDLYDYDVVPVVFCLLNSQDSVQYIRIQRSFAMDQTTLSSINKDSIFFNTHMDAELIQVEKDGSETERIKLLPTSEIIKPGELFPEEGCFLYKTDHKLFADKSYKLDIYIPKYDRHVKSSTKMVGDFNIFEPLNHPLRKIDLATNNYVPNWQAAENACIYTITLRFFYTETIDSIETPKQIDCYLLTIQNYGNESNNELTCQLRGPQLYGELIRKIDEAESNCRRKFHHVDFGIWASAEDYAMYYESRNSMETIQMDGVPYTNIDNGIGIFSSRYYSEVKDIFLSDNTIDSISKGEMTRHLNFADSRGFYPEN